MSGKRPTLAVDLLYFTGKRGGTETYARALLPRLAEHLPGVDLLGLTNTTADESIAEWFPGATVTLGVDGENRPAWAAAEAFRVDRRASALGADLVWCPANFGPPGRRVPTVVTLHDIIADEYPNPDVSRPTQAITSWLIRRAARGARLVITGSEDASASITRVVGVPQDRIRVVPHGAASASTVEDPAGELAPLGIDGSRPLVLSTGNRMPHKNFATLVRAIAQIPADRRPVLAITGSHGVDPLAPLVAELGLERDVRLLGWVTRAQLEALFAQAAVYVCPSLAEGFGLPVVDAMVHGTAVLASDIGVLREVGGDAARYYGPPRDPAALARELVALLDDPERRAAQVRDGRERAARFTWERSAELTAQALDEALRG